MTPFHKQEKRPQNNGIVIEETRCLDEFKRTLASLTVNNKDIIDALTKSAGIGWTNAVQIVDMILNCKPTEAIVKLYLIDSILKNIGGIYLELFGQILVSTFTTIFKIADVNTRKKMYILRCTWNDVLSRDMLLSLDNATNKMDFKWPVKKSQTCEIGESVVTDVNVKVCLTMTSGIVIH